MAKKTRTKEDSQKIRRILTAILCVVLIAASILPMVAQIFMY